MIDPASQKQPPEVFYKSTSGVLKNFAKFTGKPILFLIKLQAKNIFFTEHLWATASGSPANEKKSTFYWHFLLPRI